MIDIVYRGKMHRVAETWDELRPVQYLQIMHILQSPSGETLSGRLHILKVLLGMKWWKFMIIPAGQKIQLLSFAAWVETDTSLSRQLVPVFYCRGALHGPCDGFSNIRAAEFHFADMYYTAWKEYGEDIDLCRFISCLYRPKKKRYDVRRNPDGDIRQPFNPNVIEFYAARINDAFSASKIKSAAMAAVLCYEAWRMEMETQHQRIFSAKNVKKAENLGWMPVLRGIAKAGQYGSFADVEQMYLGNLLTELEILKDEEIELRRKHPELYKNA